MRYYFRGYGLLKIKGKANQELFKKNDCNILTLLIFFLHRITPALKDAEDSDFRRIKTAFLNFVMLSLSISYSEVSRTDNWVKVDRSRKSFLAERCD